MDHPGNKNHGDLDPVRELLNRGDWPTPAVNPNPTRRVAQAASAWRWPVSKDCRRRQGVMGVSSDDCRSTRGHSDNVGFHRDDESAGELCRALGNNPRLPSMGREEVLSLLRAERAVIEDEIAALRSQQRD